MKAKNEVQDVTIIENEIQQKTIELQRVLEDLEKKKLLSKNRMYFIHVLDELNIFKENLKEDNALESDKGFIELQGRTSTYRSEKICKISNPLILLKFLDFIEKEIFEKIKEIEAELLNS